MLRPREGWRVCWPTTLLLQSGAKRPSAARWVHVTQRALALHPGDPDSSPVFFYGPSGRRVSLQMNWKEQGDQIKTLLMRNDESILCMCCATWDYRHVLQNNPPRRQEKVLNMITSQRFWRTSPIPFPCFPIWLVNDTLFVYCINKRESSLDEDEGCRSRKIIQEFYFWGYLKIWQLAESKSSQPHSVAMKNWVKAELGHRQFKQKEHMAKNASSFQSSRAVQEWVFGLPVRNCRKQQNREGHYTDSNKLKCRRSWRINQGLL